jgi:sucrose synthase
LKAILTSREEFTMHELVQSILNGDEKTALRELLLILSGSEKKYFLRNEIVQAFAQYCDQTQKPPYFYHSSSVGKLINYTHEIILEDENSWFLVRPRIASQEAWRLTADMTSFEVMTPQVLLDVRDRLVNRYQPHILEIDLHPFYKDSPQIDDARNIGQGLTFLNRYLCNQLLTDRQYWLEVLFNALQRLKYDRIPLLIGEHMASGDALYSNVKLALKFLNSLSPEEPYEKFRVQLRELGFEPGWGNTASRVRETLELLDRLIETPEPGILEAFVARVPAVFRVVMISIHGWVGQEDVLGRPETSSQVAYVLEQARNLENKLQEEIITAGLGLLGIKPYVTILTRLIPNCEGTHCDLRQEKIEGTENGWILRVPFGEFNPEVTQNWISKYEIWPYLETFAQDAEKQLLAQLGGRPNLIMGNYSDGNLVAFLLARKMKVTQCNIAHSLEKPKHLFSNLYWQDLEEHYHFSAQFTADIISMNAADFIITSSYQEIVGTPDTMGQYESYKCFTMPELYHVVDGIDLFSTKFNMVPPGVDEKVFFPHTFEREENNRKRIRELLFQREEAQILGKLENPDKRAIFAVATITSIKNLSGLVECFAKSAALQEHFNLVLITGKLHPDEAINSEEAGEITRIHEIIEEYHLQSKIRWLGIRLSNIDLGEAYRAIADVQGIFIHFASFEAFGRTILEAMYSGVPTFATQFGGSAEILDEADEVFHLNPTDLEGTAKKILHFIEECDRKKEYWQQISEQVNQRVHNKYNWQLHTKKLLLLAKLYGFWDLVTQENQEGLLRYLETIYHLIYKPKAEKILEKHMQK